MPMQQQQRQRRRSQHQDAPAVSPGGRCAAQRQSTQLPAAAARHDIPPPPPSRIPRRPCRPAPSPAATSSSHLCRHGVRRPAVERMLGGLLKVLAPLQRHLPATMRHHAPPAGRQQRLEGGPLLPGGRHPLRLPAAMLLPPGLQGAEGRRWRPRMYARNMHARQKRKWKQKLGRQPAAVSCCCTGMQALCCNALREG